MIPPTSPPPKPSCAVSVATLTSRVATVLQAVLKKHFGSSNAQLTAFGIKPFRGLKRARKADAPAGAAKKKDAAPKPSAE